MVAQERSFVPLVKILGPSLTIRDFITDHKVHRLQEAMRDHNRGTFFAFSAGKAPKLRAEIGGFGMAHGVGTFH
jgi:hypothetical protein